MEAKTTTTKYSVKNVPRNNITIVDIPKVTRKSTAKSTRKNNSQIVHNTTNSNHAVTVATEVTTTKAVTDLDAKPEESASSIPKNIIKTSPINTDNVLSEPFNLRDLINHMANYTGPDVLGELQQLCGAHIFVRHDKFGTPSTDYERIMLTTNRHASPYDRELDSQCNGVVLTYPQCKLLALCQRNFHPRPKIRVLAEHIKEYDIYPINDGTTITLYYYNGKWRISSTNGIDIGDFKWVGTSTYMEAVNGAMKKYNVSCDNLNVAYSYTIGFRCVDYHPLIDPAAPTCWVIQICDLEKYELVTNHLAIPVQRPIMIPGTGDRKLEFTKKINEASVNSYKEMRTQAHNGYIFRHKTGAKCDFILESLLFKSIKKLIYNLPGRSDDLPPIPSTQRLQYCALRAYLHKTNHKLFIDLFPQFQPNYDNFDIIFNAMVNRIIANLRGTSQSSNTANKQLDALVTIIASSIKECGFDAMNPDCESIIMDFVMNVNYIEMYFKFITK